MSGPETWQQISQDFLLLLVLYHGVVCVENRATCSAKETDPVTRLAVSGFLMFVPVEESGDTADGTI
jgi:hypothetical protein